MYVLDRKLACHLKNTNHGSWCWECFDKLWITDEESHCSTCENTWRDPIPWCELFSSWTRK